MEWFGMTYCGYPDPIKEMMKPSYKEPEVQLEIEDIIAKGTKKTFSELIAVLDCCIGRVDGYAYKSYDRLTKMRRKGVLKPVGPTEMYSYAGTDGMKPGFWMSGPFLTGKKWYKTPVFKPKPSTDVTIYVNEVRKIDKYFCL